jgi:hypothetical protein
MAQARLPRKPDGRRPSSSYLTDRGYSAAEVEFMFAVHAYKQAAGNQFPSLSEILKVLLSLGYKKENPV